MYDSRNQHLFKNGLTKNIVCFQKLDTIHISYNVFLEHPAFYYMEMYGAVILSGDKCRRIQPIFRRWASPFTLFSRFSNG
jgi:hypothetical protein